VLRRRSAASGAACPRGRLQHDPPPSGACLRHAPRLAPGPRETNGPQPAGRSPSPFTRADTTIGSTANV